MLKKLIGLGLILGIIYSTSSIAARDDSAAIVELRTSCFELNTEIDNCFESLDELNTWIQGTRSPGPTDPLVVRIGPGTFPGFFNCKGDQHISLIGSGSIHTSLKRTGVGYGMLSVMELKDNCNLSVQDLKIDNIGGLGAINVADTTTSTFNILSKWENVEIITTGYTWVEEHCDPAITGSKHFWTGSKLTSFTDGSTFGHFAKTYVSCAENWFHATEITAIKDVDTPSVQVAALLILGETHVYGGVIRAITGNGVVLPSPAPYSGGAGPQGLVAIYAANPGANVHVHGAGIDVLSDESNDVAAILTENNAHVHVMESSFNMSSCDNSQACGGTLQRIANHGGMVRSTFQWENGTEPPNISSQDGADTFVETDCLPAGCDMVGTHPHMLIYSTQCEDPVSGTGVWFDTVTGACSNK